MTQKIYTQKMHGKTFIERDDFEWNSDMEEQAKNKIFQNSQHKIDDEEKGIYSFNYCQNFERITN